MTECVCRPWTTSELSDLMLVVGGVAALLYVLSWPILAGCGAAILWHTL